MSAGWPARWMLAARAHGLSTLAAVASIASLSGCAVEWLNLEPAREVAAQSEPSGSVYTGWRVFQDRCAACHGPAATGTAAGSNLLPTIREMGPRRFVSVVLTRYDWVLPPAQAGSEGPAREALIDDIVQRKTTALPMPAWEGEPSVNAHIVDLYAYLVARAEGTQGPGRPAP